MQISPSFPFHPQLPFRFPGSATNGQSQSISERSHKADGLQRELQTREREMGNRVVKEESWERLLSPETRKLWKGTEMGRY